MRFLMRNTRIIIVVLLLALVGSNLWWVYRVLDMGVTATYSEASLKDYRTALMQTFALLPVVARRDVTRETIVSAARLESKDLEPFEKDGYVWVNRIGLKFDRENRLIEVIPGWDPF